MPEDKKSTLIVSRHSPYGSSLARSAIDIALATAAFEQSVSILFLGDGALQLIADQDAKVLGSKNISKQIASFPLYDIEQVYADEESLAQFSIVVANAPVPVKTLPRAQLHTFMSEFDHLLSL